MLEDVWWEVNCWIERQRDKHLWVDLLQIDYFFFYTFRLYLGATRNTEQHKHSKRKWKNATGLPFPAPYQLMAEMHYEVLWFSP